MRHKKLAAACLAGCLCLQAAGPSYAATVVAGEGSTVSDSVGPAQSGPAAFAQPWEKVDGRYRDDQGNAIEGALKRGVSVSKWQGDIDWAQVAADDISFAMIRMVSYGYEGEITVDETFDRNMREAAAHGVSPSPYVYLQTKTVEEARAAAQFAVDTTRNYMAGGVIAVDVESQYILDLSTQELTDVVNAFCQVIAQNGYTPLIYSDYWKFTNEMDTSQFPYDIWLARYGAGSDYANRTMWQPTDQGSVNGISGNVCLEFAYKDYGSTGAPAAQAAPAAGHGQGTGSAPGPSAAGPGQDAGTAQSGASPVITVE